jgi:glycine cleavage system H protein
VAEGRTHEEQWDALRAIQGLAILEVLSTFDVGQLRDLQQALAELPTGSSVMANMVVATQRILQPMTKVPARIEPAAAARAAALAGFPDTLLGKNYEDLAVTSAELGAAVVLARVGKLVTDEAAQHAGRVLADELARLVASDAVNVDCVQPILAGIVASGCAMPTEQAVAVATAVRRSFQGRYRKVGDMCADPVAFVGHLAADNLVHEADRFDALVAAEVPAEETERDPALLGCSLPRELFYFGGHAWIRPEADGTVRVGIDELAARLVGRLDAVEMPRKGAHLRQGKPALRLVRGGESVDVPAPIDGDVMIVNRSAIDQPGSIATEPYGSGWLFLVRPTAPERSVPKLLFAQAARTWERAEVERVTGMFRDANVGATAADGATLAHDPLASISGVRWSDVLKKIFRG